MVGGVAGCQPKEFGVCPACGEGHKHGTPGRNTQEKSCSFSWIYTGGN